MVVVCAWCKLFLRREGDGDDRISHGICKPCAEGVLEEVNIVIGEVAECRALARLSINKAAEARQQQEAP